MTALRPSDDPRGAGPDGLRARRLPAAASPGQDTRARAAASLVVGVLGLALAARAQEAPIVHPVADAAAATVGVLFAQGFDDDPEDRAGLAAVLAAARLAQGRRAAGELLASGAKVGADYAIVFAVVGPEQRGAAAAFVRALFDDGAGLDDDALELAIARAALAADDAEHLYPGDVLRTRARRRLGGGEPFARPPAGHAPACSALTPAEVRSALAVRAPARVAALGAVEPAWARALAAASAAAVRCPPRGQAACTARWRQRAMTEDLSERADSPYVAAAVAAPGGDERAIFAVAAEVARARAFRQLPLRGRELFARAPFLKWSWLEADPIAVFFRRGADPVQVLPGERGRATVADELAATRGELESLLDDLRRRAPTQGELEAARRALRGRLLLPVPGGEAAWAGEPATYPGRVQVLLLRAHHGVDVARTEAVTGAQVQATLAAALAEERVSWHAVVPRPRDGLGYPRR